MIDLTQGNSRQPSLDGAKVQFLLHRRGLWGRDSDALTNRAGCRLRHLIGDQDLIRAILRDRGAINDRTLPKRQAVRRGQ